MIILTAQFDDSSKLEKVIALFKKLQIPFRFAEPAPNVDAKLKRTMELIEAIEWSNALSRGEIQPNEQSFTDFLNELEKEIQTENQTVQHAD